MRVYSTARSSELLATIMAIIYETHWICDMCALPLGELGGVSKSFIFSTPDDCGGELDMTVLGTSSKSTASEEIHIHILNVFTYYMTTISMQSPALESQRL